MTDTIETASASRAKRLKVLTHAVHDRLDTSIMAAASFASREGYARFVAIQFLFHRDLDALYGDAALQAVLPGLAERRQLPLLKADLSDLSQPEPATGTAPAFVPGEVVDLPTAIGWLYVAEGSRMGAAVLRKAAAKLGLSDDHGARHLAPASEGPAAYWRAFTAALDGIELDAEQEERVIAGANAAFMRVQDNVDDHLR